MAREACLVATPSIYTGGRKMAVNQEFVRRGFMFPCSSKGEILEAMNRIIETDLKRSMAEKIPGLIEQQWCDVTEVILRTLRKFLS